MKKICIVALLCLFTLPLSAFFTITNDATKGELASVLDMFSTGVNSGLATATVPPRIFNAGFQANFAMNKDDSLQKLGDSSNYFFPVLYANLRLGDFLFFGRGFAINQRGANFWYAGGGMGYIVSDYKLLFPQIRLLGAYHILDASHSQNDIRVSTATVNAIADYKLPIPIFKLHALANIAYERNMMDVSGNAITNRDLGVNRVRFSVGAAAEIFWILNLSYEYTILPNPNHNIGISVGF